MIGAGIRLVRDPMLQLPDAERGQEEALRPRQRAGRGQFSFHGLSAVVLPRTSAFRFALAGAARGFTDGEVTSVIHGGQKSSFQAMVFPLVRASVLHQLAGS